MELIVIFVLVEILVVLLMASLAIILLRPLFRLLVKGVLIVVGAAAMFLAGGLGLVLAISSAESGNTVGILAGVGIAVAIPLMLAFRNWRDRDEDDYGGQTQKAQPALPPVYSGPVEGKGDRTVTEAWATLSGMVSGEKLGNLHAARAHCARVLAAADREGMDMELVSIAVLIRQRLPELARRNAALWEDADEDEREELASGILEDMKALSKHAQGEFARSRKSHRDALFALRKHIARQTNTSD